MEADPHPCLCDDLLQCSARASPRKNSNKRRRNPKNHLGGKGGVYYSHRRDGRVVPLIVLPKILKSDLRRQYASMFCNVFNSCDSELMRDFIGKFCEQNAMFRRRRLQPGWFAERVVDIAGTPAAMTFWEGLVEATPDIVFSVADTRLSVRSDGTAKVMFSFIMGGSRIVLGGSTESGVFTSLGEPKRSTTGVVVSLPDRPIWEPRPFRTHGSALLLLETTGLIELLHFDILEWQDS